MHHFCKSYSQSMPLRKPINQFFSLPWSKLPVRQSKDQLFNQQSHQSPNISINQFIKEIIEDQIDQSSPPGTSYLHHGPRPLRRTPTRPARQSPRTVVAYSKQFIVNGNDFKEETSYQKIQSSKLWKIILILNNLQFRLFSIIIIKK